MDNEPDLILRLIAQLHKQREKGIKNYGSSIIADTYSLEYWLTHLCEEQVDSLAYSYAALDHVTKMRMRIEELEAKVRGYENAQ